MKTRFGRLAIAAMLLSGSSMVVANDGTSVVGDLPGYGEDAYFGEDAAYTKVETGNETYEGESADADQNFAGDYVADENFDSDTFENSETSENGVRPVAHHQQAVQRASGRSVMRQASARLRNSQSNHMRPVSHEMMGSGYVDGGYSDCGCGDSSCGDSSCGGGISCGAEMDCGCGSTSCDGGSSCGTHKRMSKLFDRLHGNTWAQVDTLLWFTQARDTPPLVITSDAGTPPFLPETPADIANNPNNVQTVFGDDLQGDLTVGIRADAGVWLTDRIGVGGRFWALTESEDNYFFSGDGTDMSVGRAFFNTNPTIAGEDALAVAINGAGDPDLSGTIAAESSLELYAAESYARLRFGCSKNCKLDFIGGYSYFNIKDNLSIASLSTAETAGALGVPTVGDQFAFLDRFRTENEFNGGQLGFEMQMNRGRWNVRSLTKVHLGNMNQAISQNGSTTITPFGGNPTTTSGGVLTGSTPIANEDTERDVFAFAPEANFKLGYRFRPNVSLNVGYSFIYFDNVALTGDTIDRNTDGADFQTNNNDNGFLVDDSSLFVHGIDLGFTIDF